MSYYITTHEYVGPNARDPYGRRYRELLYIQSDAPRTNVSHEIRTEGWLGTTNDWSVHAHGKFATLEEARAAVAARWNTYEIEYDEEEEPVVEIYGVGEVDPRGIWDAGDWLAHSGVEVAADATDEEVAAMAREFEAEAEGDGATVDGIEEYLLELREQAQDEARLAEY
jgi:hypothetical protein